MASGVQSGASSEGGEWSSEGGECREYREWSVRRAERSRERRDASPSGECSGEFGACFFVFHIALKHNHLRPSGEPSLRELLQAPPLHGHSLANGHGHPH